MISKARTKRTKETLWTKGLPSPLPLTKVHLRPILMRWDSTSPLPLQKGCRSLFYICNVLLLLHFHPYLLDGIAQIQYLCKKAAKVYFIKVIDLCCSTFCKSGTAQVNYLYKMDFCDPFVKVASLCCPPNR